MAISGNLAGWLGHIKWAFGTAATAGPMYQAKKVKFLALAAPKRLSGFPDVPTF